MVTDLLNSLFDLFELLGHDIVKFFGFFPKCLEFLFKCIYLFLEFINLFPYPLNWVLVISLFVLIVRFIFNFVFIVWEFFPGN